MKRPPPSVDSRGRNNAVPPLFCRRIAPAALTGHGKYLPAMSPHSNACARRGLLASLSRRGSALRLREVFRGAAALPYSGRKLSLPAGPCYFFPSLPLFSIWDVLYNGKFVLSTGDLGGKQNIKNRLTAKRIYGKLLSVVLSKLLRKRQYTVGGYNPAPRLGVKPWNT